MAETGRFGESMRWQTLRAVTGLEDQFELVTMAQFDADGDYIEPNPFIHSTYPLHVALSDDGIEWVNEHADW